MIQTPRDRAILESQAREKFENRRKNKNRNSRKLDDSLFDMGLFDEDEEEAGLGQPDSVERFDWSIEEEIGDGHIDDATPRMSQSNGRDTEMDYDAEIFDDFDYE